MMFNFYFVVYLCILKLYNTILEPLCPLRARVEFYEIEWQNRQRSDSGTEYFINDLDH